MLSRFWPLRGWRGWVIGDGMLRKIFCDKNLFFKLILSEVKLKYYN